MPDELNTTQMAVVCQLPNGCTLYREPNEVGGHRLLVHAEQHGEAPHPTISQGVPVTDAPQATITEELRRDEAIEGALRYMVEHPENQEKDMLGWSHIEALIRQIDRLRGARGNGNAPKS